MRIVVQREQLADERVEVAARGRVVPALDRLACRAAERGARGASASASGSARKCAYSSFSSATRSGCGVLDADASAPRASPRAAHRAAAPCRSSGSPIRRRPDAPDRSARARRGARLSNAFCDGCGSSGRSPSSEPRCRASASRSSTCAPSRGERGEQPALAGAGEAADDRDSESAPAASASRATTCRR